MIHDYFGATKQIMLDEYLSMEPNNKGRRIKRVGNECRENAHWGYPFISQGFLDKRFSQRANTSHGTIHEYADYHKGYCHTSLYWQDRSHCLGYIL